MPGAGRRGNPSAGGRDPSHRRWIFRWRAGGGMSQVCRMKKMLWLGIGVAMATWAWAVEPLARRVTAEEFRAAGLDKLSPAELAQLDALFQKYGADQATAVMSGAKAVAPAVRQTEIEAAARVAAAEARARKAEAEAAVAREAAQTAKAEQKKAEEGFLAKAKKVLVSPGTKVEVMATETEIDGWFDGWDANTTWRMADGSFWRVENKPAAYQAKRVKNPKVKIYPAAVTGYWLEFVDLDYKLRVRQVK